jgi:hypothetical protein
MIQGLANGKALGFPWKSLGRKRHTPFPNFLESTPEITYGMKNGTSAGQLPLTPFSNVASRLPKMNGWCRV